MPPNSSQAIQNQIHDLATKVEVISNVVDNNRVLMNQQAANAKVYSDQLSELNITNSEKFGELNTTIKLFLQRFENILLDNKISKESIVEVEKRLESVEKVQSKAETTIQNVKVLMGFLGFGTLMGIYEFVDKFWKK